MRERVTIDANGEIRMPADAIDLILAAIDRLQTAFDVMPDRFVTRAEHRDLERRIAGTEEEQKVQRQSIESNRRGLRIALVSAVVGGLFIVLATVLSITDAHIWR